MSALFSPLTLRGTTFRNRAWVSPMCQYSAEDGMPGDWHLVNLGARAVGGAGLVLTEASAVSPEGRISPQDTGFWSDAQADAWGRVFRFVQSQGAAVGVQLAHAGRKASTPRPWEQDRSVVPSEHGGWETVGTSPVPFGRYPAPRELSVAELAVVRQDFADAAVRAHAVGADVVELHAAHGYLLHTFLSPLSNTRTDGYGGDFTGRTRFAIEVTEAVREVWPEDKPLFFRISASDWAEGGWTLEETVELGKLLADRGVDLMDCSSGGLTMDQQITVGPGYQVPFAAAVRAGSGLPTGAVGMITDAQQAERILVDGEADAILLGRELLRDPHWPLRAAHELGVDVTWPDQYVRARPFA